MDKRGEEVTQRKTRGETRKQEDTERDTGRQDGTRGDGRGHEYMREEREAKRIRQETNG